MKQGISEYVAEGQAAGDNSQVRIYRALRALLCSRCGMEIESGALFTRKLLQGIYLTPQCQKCVPFASRTTSKGKKEELIESLFHPTPDVTTPAKNPARTRKIVEKRLGPALSRKK
ncbi:MAG TPA: hypothetical protein VM870_06085 [Pyrinomonadaceae bacterium]|jgi:RNase P subunit RPR2|nr:hypothetical protein [Pyrinomonadaceae bacterium]